MNNRRQIPFVFNNTWLGYAYSNGYWVKGLIDVGRFASYLTPSQLLTSTFTLIAPTIANKTNNPYLITGTDVVATGLNFLANPVSFIATYGVNYLSDQFLTAGWECLSEEQQNYYVYQEFFAAIHIGKLEFAKKVAEIANETKSQAEKEAQKNKDLKKLESDANLKQQQADEAQRNADKLKQEQAESDDTIHKIVSKKTKKDFHGNRLKPYVKNSNGKKESISRSQAKQQLQETGSANFKSKHSDVTVTIPGRTELNQKVSNANTQAESSLTEANIARETLTQATEQNLNSQQKQQAIRTCQEQIQQENMLRAQQLAEQEAIRREQQEATRRAQEQEQEQQDNLRRVQEIMLHVEQQEKMNAIRYIEEQEQQELIRPAQEQEIMRPAQVQKQHDKQINQIIYREKSEIQPSKKQKISQTSNGLLPSQSIFATSQNSQSRKVGAQTLGDSLNIALIINQQGGDKKAQLDAQNLNRPKL